MAATLRRPAPIGAACLAVAALSVAPVGAQQQPAVDPRGSESEATQFYFVPFGGLPRLSGVGRVQQAIGAHVVWPAASRVALSGRYELRRSAGAFYDSGSLDVSGRIVGTDTVGISITSGWARWGNTDYSTIGARVNWPFMPPEPGWFPVVQGWFDLRYTARTAREFYRLQGGMWSELMLSFVLPMRIGSK